MRSWAKYCTITNIFFLTRIWSQIVKFFIGNPKICLYSCLENTYVPPETPRRGILFLGHPAYFCIMKFISSSICISQCRSPFRLKVVFSSNEYFSISDQLQNLVLFALENPSTKPTKFNTPKLLQIQTMAKFTAQLQLFPMLYKLLSDVALLGN